MAKKVRKNAIKIRPDELWKSAIEDFADEFLRYFFGDWVEENVDFSRPIEFFDKELSAIIRRKKGRQRHADKLLKVYTKDGGQQYFLVHVEVQGYKDEQFAERMFTYYLRIFDRWPSIPVCSLAIFTDRNREHHPSRFSRSFLGTSVHFEYQVLRLWEKSREELLVPGNLFSIFLEAAKIALDPKNRTDEAQLEWKPRLLRQLLSITSDKEKIRQALPIFEYMVNFQQTESVDRYENYRDRLTNNQPTMGIEELMEKKFYQQVVPKIKRELKAQVAAELRQEVAAELRAEIEEKTKAELEAKAELDRMKAEMEKMARELEELRKKK